jgi:hypothetical protein
MSEIDEIMTAILNYGEGCWSRSDTDTAKTRQGLRDLIAAAIADARREGAEQMRRAAAIACDARSMCYADDGGSAGDCAIEIRALPLPTGPRQAARLTDAEIAEAFLSQCPAHLRGAHDVRDMQARPDVMELGRVIETAVLAANGLGAE